MLKAGGLVDELDLMHYGGDQHYYETRLKQEHAHVICMRCGKVEEFFGEPLQRLRKQIESHFGFQISAGAHRSGRILRPLPGAAGAGSGSAARPDRGTGAAPAARPYHPEVKL